MRTIESEIIKNTVKKMCSEANYRLSEDLCGAIGAAYEASENETERNTLKIIKDNMDCAAKENIPICQDTGMAVFFIEVGQEVYIKGNLTDAVNQGVREGYSEGYLRKSVVADPIRRGNTNDNTPAVIHYNIVPGDKIKIIFAPKGFGSENMSRIKMLKPSDGRDGIIDFVVETVKAAGSNPCPPIVIGIGIGGDFELCAELSKKALTLPVNHFHEDEFYADMQREILNRVNSLEIGPQGFGGKTTALWANILTYPTHIAGMPCAVNISCHVTRHTEAEI